MTQKIDVGATPRIEIRPGVGPIGPGVQYELVQGQDR